MRFELRNTGTAPIALPVHIPFLAFAILAEAGGKALTVHQPALDIGINPATIRIAPGGAATIHTPVRLRIAEGAEPGSEGFIWTIAHRRGDVSLRVRLDLPPPFADPCPLLLR